MTYELIIRGQRRRGGVWKNSREGEYAERFAVLRRCDERPVAYFLESRYDAELFIAAHNAATGRARFASA